MTSDCGNFHPSSDGIIAGCTQSQEWLLPWWWLNLRLHDSHPVTFVNLGDMSKKALDWCEQRGEIRALTLPDDFVSSKNEVDVRLASIWESTHAQVWQMRLAWFKKPFALLHSPYQRTVWLDVDCQVRGSLKPLFEYCENEGEIAMKKEEAIFHELEVQQGLVLSSEQIYNSGVIVFKKGADVIQDWARQALSQNRFFMGDQQLLSRILFVQKVPIALLPATYNWRMDLGPNSDARILHWLGRFKNHVQTQMEILRTQFFIDLSLPSGDSL